MKWNDMKCNGKIITSHASFKSKNRNNDRKFKKKFIDSSTTRIPSNWCFFSFEFFNKILCFDSEIWLNRDLQCGALNPSMFAYLRRGNYFLTLIAKQFVMKTNHHLACFLRAINYACDKFSIERLIYNAFETCFTRRWVIDF